MRPSGLATWAVVCFVVCVAYPLHRCRAHGTQLSESAMHGHARSKGGDFFGKAVAGLGTETVNPFNERSARGRVKPLRLVFCELVRKCQR